MSAGVDTVLRNPAGVNFRILAGRRFGINFTRHLFAHGVLDATNYCILEVTGNIPSDEQLWSWIDREAPELDAHLAAHPEGAPRVDGIRAVIGRLEAQNSASQHPERIGEYHIRGLLGRGGMGLVYDAEQDHPRRRVALKMLPVEAVTNQRRLELFRREANALARLSHPGIAVIYEVGDAPGGYPYIAMERIDGPSLDSYVADNPLSRRQRITLARDICIAVGHAHDHGVVHRDIKPQNVLVKQDGNPVVVDFGLARIQDDGLTQASLASQAGSFMGTLPYMSPEQVSGRGRSDQRSDVYSLGVLLFELVTGKRPQQFEGLTLVEAAKMIQDVPPRLQGIRGDLRTVVLKALEKEPRRRYSSAGALAADLQRYLDGRIVEATRPGVVRTVTATLRRHWIAASFLFISTGLLLVLLFPVRLPVPLFGSWFEGAPFEEVRWVHDTPQVRLRERWYGLVAIEDLKAAYIIGFCQQHTEGRWRKRFSEDLVQVINRLGLWHIHDVDLTLRDLETDETVTRVKVPLSLQWRRDIWRVRHAWPWSVMRRVDDSLIVEYLDDEWRLMEVDGLDITQVSEDIRREELYDVYCDRLGYSPGNRIDFLLENVKTSERRSFENIERMARVPKFSWQ